MTTKTIEVVIAVKVTVDESKFTPEFMDEFKESFYQFDDLDDHMKHIAQMEARGILTGSANEFIEGYGLAMDMGIECEIESVDMNSE